MKRLLLAAALIAASVLGAEAQNAVGQVTFQPRVGVSLADVTKFGDTDIRCGLVAGAEVEYGVSDIFALTGGVFYSMQGAKEKLGTESRETVGATWKLDYINIPVMAQVYVAKGLAVKLGLQPGFKVNSEVKVAALGGQAETDLDGVKGFDLSMPVGLSYEYCRVVFDFRYNWGLTKLFDNADSKNSVFQLTLGYKF